MGDCVANVVEQVDNDGLGSKALDDYDLSTVMPAVTFPSDHAIAIAYLAAPTGIVFKPDLCDSDDDVNDTIDGGATRGNPTAAPRADTSA